MVDFTDPTTVGYTFLVVGILLFLLEASMPGFFVGVPATVLVILGVFALVAPSPEAFNTFAPIVAVVVGVPALFVAIWAYRKIAPPTDSPTTETGENLVGRTGVVTVRVIPDSPRGKVKIAQQSWSALTEGAPIPEGTHVRVVRVDGVIVFVTPTEEKTGA